MTRRRIRVCFDLDGVLVGRPIYLPKKFVDFVARGKSSTVRNLHFRYPDSFLERNLRWFSHHPFFRPQIIDNVRIVKELSKISHYELFVVSGRYDFLKQRSHQWLKANKIHKCFKGIYINDHNQEAHLFKEKVLKELKADIFFEDDELIIRYLKPRIRASIVPVLDFQARLPLPAPLKKLAFKTNDAS